ncbi:MAG: putative DNA binding domain-containing protein, partial [Akkermansia sp.]
MNNTSSELTLLQQEVLDLYHTEEWIEGLNLEFKSSKVGLPKDFWPTYSSFANTNGGIILLGVSDDGTIEGLSKPEQREKDLAVLLNDPQKCSSNLSFVPGMIEKVTIAGAIILAIKVPCAEPKDKPVYLNGHLECSYFRQHESDIQCNDAMLQQMLRDKTEASKDANIIPYSTIEDLDKHTFQQFRNRMGSFFPGHTWLADNDKTLLTKLGGYRRDRQTGEEGITLAGLLMFGTNESISEFFPQFQMNYYEFDDSEDIHKRWSDRITSDGTWTANLYQFFFRVLPRMNEGLKVPFKLNPDMTRQGESPAHIAVREALANAIVHADYHGDGGIIINKSSKKLELSNPGTLL